MTKTLLLSQGLSYALTAEILSKLRKLNHRILFYLIASQMLVPPKKLSDNRFKGHAEVVAGFTRVLINLDEVIIVGKLEVVYVSAK